MRPPSWLELALAVMVALMAAKALTASVVNVTYGILSYIGYLSLC